MTSELPDFKDLLPSDDSDNDDGKVTAADVRLLFNPSAPEPPDEFDPEYARAALLALEQRVVPAGRPPIALEGRRILMEGPLKKKGKARGLRMAWQGTMCGDNQCHPCVTIEGGGRLCVFLPGSAPLSPIGTMLCCVRCRIPNS